jgi:hypothetical protein
MVNEVCFRDDAYYDQDALCRLLKITRKAIGNACRSGDLKVSERAGTRFFRGDWINAWLSADTADKPLPINSGETHS